MIDSRTVCDAIEAAAILGMTPRAVRKAFPQFQLAPRVWRVSEAFLLQLLGHPEHQAPADLQTPAPESDPIGPPPPLSDGPGREDIDALLQDWSDQEARLSRSPAYFPPLAVIQRNGASHEA